MGRVNAWYPLLAVLALVLVMAGGAGAQPFSNFDDGTLQGWTKLPPFNGDLENPGTGGNPGGYMFCRDTMAGGGGLLALAPPEFTGDLRRYDGVRWDEYLFYCSDTNEPTYPLLFALIDGDSTLFAERNRQVGPLEVWRERFVPFDPGSWERRYGTATFDEVLRNVTELRMNMDCNGNCHDEAGIDNIGYGLLPSTPDPGQCTVSPWDSYARAFGTPGHQSNVDDLEVFIADQSGVPLPAVPVEIIVSACGLCLDPEDHGLRGETDAAGTVLLNPALGGCEECTVRVQAGNVVIRTYSRFVSTDWDGVQADGRVDEADVAFLQGALGTNEPCADYNGDGMVNLVDVNLFYASYSMGDANTAGCALAAMSDFPAATVGRGFALALTPNPIRSGSPLAIACDVPASGRVLLRLFDINGRSVMTLAAGQRTAGTHALTWDGRGPAGEPLAAGIYFLRLAGSGGQATQKLVLLR